MMAKIRQALKSALLPDTCGSIPASPFESATDDPNLVEHFMLELGSVGVSAQLAATPAQATAMILDLLDAAADRCESAGAAKEILAWDDSEFPIQELGSAVRAAGFVPLDLRLPDDRKLRRERLAELGKASAGLTGAQGGLADSGTLALLSGPSRPRLASLLPPVHIAVISKHAIYSGMSAFFAAHSKAVLQASNLVFITGPSRTADIEQTLTLGVHGPREVFAIIVD